MSNPAHRQSKIQEKRKQTSWREFVMEICSWYSLMFYKNKDATSLYPLTDRSNIVSMKKNGEIIMEGENTNNFIKDIELLFSISFLPAINHWGKNENADFAETAVNVRNAYLSFTVIKGSQNVIYSVMVRASNDVINSIEVVDGSSIVYSSIAIINSASIFYSKYIINSHDIWFSENLTGCYECLYSYDLQNKSYVIHNVEHTKEEYIKQKIVLLSDKNNFTLSSFYALKSNNYGSQNSVGKFILQSRDIDNGYMVNNRKQGKNLIMIGNVDEGELAYDFMIGGAGCKHVYGCVNSGNYSEHLYCSRGIGKCCMCLYSYNLEDCSFCLGCIGLKNKSYCILNKQYTKEERYIRVDEIFAQMESDGTLGQFFPATMNPFYFNDTAAYLIDPTFTKEEVTAAGYLRRDEPIKVDIPDGAVVVSTKDLGIYEGWMIGTEFFPSTTDRKSSIPTNATRYINPDILKVIIQDEEGNVYKIVKMEYDFLMKHELPLPRKHWLERMKDNFRIS